MSSSIVRCSSYAVPFKGPASISLEVIDRLIDSRTTPKEFKEKRKSLSQYQFNLFSGGSLGTHPLAQAAYHGNLEMIQFLFDEGGPALLKLGDSSGRIPLFLATTSRQFAAIEKLLNLGSPINVTHTSLFLQRGATALSLAITLKDEDIAKLLIKYGALSRKDMDDTDKAFHTNLVKQIKKEKADLTLAIDVATGNNTFPLELRNLITDYA